MVAVDSEIGYKQGDMSDCKTFIKAGMKICLFGEQVRHAYGMV